MPPTATADAIFLKFEGIGSEDLVVVLKLVDFGADGVAGGGGVDADTFTTKAIVVDNSDIYTALNPAPVGFGLVLAGNDGAVIIEKNDYNAAGENWTIQGAHIFSSP